MTLIDIIQIYNYGTDRDLNDVNALFKDIDIDERLDKNILIGSILDECGAMNVIYNTSWAFKFFSDNFFKKYKWNIGKLLDTLELKYDPLSNKKWNWREDTDITQNLDTTEEKNEERNKANTGTSTKDNTGEETRTIREEENTENTGTETTENTGTQGKANTGTQTTINSGTQGNSETYSSEEVNTISAMNAQSYQPDNKKDITGSRSNTRTDQLQEQRTDALNELRTDNLQEEIEKNLLEQRQKEVTDTNEQELRETTTEDLLETINATNDRTKNEDLTWDETDIHTEEGADNVIFQELIEKERKVAQFSIYNWITKKYAKELFLLIY